MYTKFITFLCIHVNGKYTTNTLLSPPHVQMAHNKGTCPTKHIKRTHKKHRTLHTSPSMDMYCGSTYREQTAVSHRQVGLTDSFVTAVICDVEAILLTHAHSLSMPDVRLQPLVPPLPSLVLLSHVARFSLLFAAWLLCFPFGIAHTSFTFIHLHKGK